MIIELNEAVVTRILQVVDRGLTRGLGMSYPGETCAQGAVNYVLGRVDLSDRPPGVLSAVACNVITVNDKTWSSSQARARGLRRLVVAQLNSHGCVAQNAYVHTVNLKFIQRIMPRIWARRDREMAARLAKCTHLGEVWCQLIDNRNARELVQHLDTPDFISCVMSSSPYELRDQDLEELADLMVETLVELKSPGCAWLPLCDVELPPLDMSTGVRPRLPAATEAYEQAVMFKKIISVSVDDAWMMTSVDVLMPVEGIGSNCPPIWYGKSSSSLPPHRQVEAAKSELEPA